MASAPDTVSLASSQPPASGTAADAHAAASGAASGTSRLPPSVAGAFAAAAYALQHSTQGGAPGESDAPAGPPYDEETGLLPQLYANRLGPRTRASSRAYYLRQFARFDALDKGLPSWNAAAGFFTLAWCCWRGLWTEAGRYLGCVAVAALVWWWSIRPSMPAPMAYGVAAALWLAAVAVPGLMGNGWLWRQVRAQTLRAITGSATVAEAHEKLAAQAGTPRQQILAGLVAALPIAAAAGAGLAWLTAQQHAAPPTAPSPASPAPAALPAASAPAPAPSPVPLPATADAEPAPPAVPAVQPAPQAAAEPPPDPAPASKPQPEHPSAPPKAQAPVPQPAKAGAAPEPAQAGAQAPAAQLQPGRFYLNVGVFSDQANAQRTAALLQDAGLTPMAQTLHSNKGEVTRIRTGPFASARQAEKAARQLRAHKLEPTVFQYASPDAHEKRAGSAVKS